MRNIYSSPTRTLATLTLAAAAISLTSCGGSGLNTTTGGTLGSTLPVGVPISIPSATPGTISGTVTNATTGEAVPGVVVRAGGVSATTNGSGTYTLTGATPSTSVLVTFDLAGYAPQARSTGGFTTNQSAVLINVPVVPVASTQTFDPAVAKVLAVSGSSAVISLPANALQTTSGGAPAGNVTAVLTPVGADSNTSLLPGNYMGVPSIGGAAEPIESFGGFDVRLTDSAGAALNLAAGVSAIVRIPLSTRSSSAPSSIPLFFYDATTGLWNEEGTATLAGTAGSQYYEGTVTHLSTWSGARFYPSSLPDTGCVVDSSGNAVVGATVAAEGVPYSSVISTTTDAGGNFTLAINTAYGGGTPANVLQATKDVRVSNSVNGGDTGPTCLVLSEFMTIRLSWGAQPLDLDSHSYGPGGNHVYWSARGSLPYLALDVDDVSGYGPEVTTTKLLAKNTSIRFFVHNYSRYASSGAPGQTSSPAKVELLIGGVPRVFTPPAGESASSQYWHVFDLNTDGNCAMSLVIAQQFSATQPSNPNPTGTPSWCL